MASAGGRTRRGSLASAANAHTARDPRSCWRSDARGVSCSLAADYGGCPEAGETRVKLINDVAFREIGFGVAPGHYP